MKTIQAPPSTAEPAAAAEPGRRWPAHALWAVPALILLAGLAHQSVQHSHAWLPGHGRANGIEHSGMRVNGPGHGPVVIPHRLEVTAGKDGLVTRRLEGEAERFYSILVTNDGAASRTWVLVRPGGERIVAADHATGRTLLDHPDVLGTTNSLGPGQSEIVAVAPQRAGDYTYLCLPRASCRDAAEGTLAFR